MAEDIRRVDDDGIITLTFTRDRKLNAVSDGLNVVLSPPVTSLDAQLRERGYHPIHVDVSELHLGGGGIKCCTLTLRGATP